MTTEKTPPNPNPPIYGRDPKPMGPSLSDELLMQAIDRVYMEEPTYGSRRQVDELEKLGYETMIELYEGLTKFFIKYNARKHQTFGMSPEKKYREGLRLKNVA